MGERQPEYRERSRSWLPIRWMAQFALLMICLLAPAITEAREVIRVPLTIHVATQDGRSVVSESRILASVRRANRELAAFDVHLVVEEIVPMVGGARIETPDDRFDLAHRAERDGTVHVFFVERVRLTSARKGDRRVSGMHWRYHGFDREIRSREYLAVAHNAPTTTLVHEIGHAFGLTHDRKTDNLMCSCRRGLAPSFTEKQGRRLRTGARRYLERNG
jgi:hypothetical protein